MEKGIPAEDAGERKEGSVGGAGCRFVFGRASLDERSMELRLDGRPVPIERKPLEVLLHLLRHAGEVVTKREFEENVWPGRILSESVLTGCISRIRAAIEDRDHEVIKTVHGFGYRFAGLVRVETAPAEQGAKARFVIGDAVPRRPQWRLAERLGAGGHGEAWLAQHEKTAEARVFKFSLEQNALVALKREITLYRLLHDSLGERAAVTRIFEWNVEEPPYYLETEYVPARDLSSWARAHGGLAQVPLAVRIDLMAQIAEAVAAAHAVGVLHKDLKPGNVLIEAGTRPRAKLCDFGSGSVLDAAYLERLGITRLGFTKTLPSAPVAGTHSYLAPEVLSGQPFTMRADVYALGVMLYQMLVGDFTRTLAPGWESQVPDELLREDVALAASGDVTHRMADAAELAARLRTLDARRQARAAEAAAAQRAERTRRMVEQLRRTRIYALVLLILATAAVVGGVIAYRARNQALTATITAHAVSDFLTEDVLRVDPTAERPREASYESLLRRAAAQVESRFHDQPAAAADVHWLLGRRFQEIGRLDEATREYERASTLYANLYGADDEATLLVLDRLAAIYVDWGRRDEAVEIARQLPKAWEQLHGADDLSTLTLRVRMARVLAFAGELKESERILRDVIAASLNAGQPNPATSALVGEWLGIGAADGRDMRMFVRAFSSAVLAGNVLAEFGDEYRESESMLRDALGVLGRLLGEDSTATAYLRVSLAYVLGQKGKYAEAETELKRARDFFDQWLPPTHYYHSVPRIILARLKLEQQQSREASALIAEALDLCRPEECNPRVRAEYLWIDGRAEAQLGYLFQAIETFTEGLSVYEKFLGTEHIGTIRIRLSLADAYWQAKKFELATQTLPSTSAGLASLGSQHLALADLRRLEGLLALERGDVEAAQSALEESMKIVSARLPAGHWRLDRAQRELAQARTRLAGQSIH